MFEDISPHLELAPDVSAGEWIASTLQPWGEDGLRLSSFMPEGFEAYVRVFHPLIFGWHTPENERRWADVAAEHAAVLTPGVSIYDVLGIDPLTSSAHPDGFPAVGELPQVICERLVAILGQHTTTEDACYFGVWSGFGVFRGGGEIPSLLVGVPTEGERREEERRREDARAQQEDVQAQLDAISKLDCGRGREHFVFRGPLSAACSIHDASWVTPALWWPQDRAWTVVTEIDGVCTYVGGSREAIDGVLASDLESIEVTLDVHIS